MSAPTPTDKVQVASISDRGLSEKRPLNEDSFLVDSEHQIFAVADGVGGADAGEVASQTAIDVLQEAFGHLKDGDDIEDLMELAIQRANSSIHQMASENPRFSMMATTIVALHLERDKATVGHVGDSRLYRLGPDGKLARETADHSIVEEEVRAGRMTPEQAANHPSKNVISRALGAERTVEVDMNTIELQSGTAFLLCSDGITRHIPDSELRELLMSGHEPEAICGALKDRCYQRGAEDNLTAVIIQVGAPRFSAVVDHERTLDMPATQPLIAPSAGVPPLTPPSRIAFPGPAAAPTSAAAPLPRPSRSGAGRAFLRFFVFLLFVAVAAGAFYGGMKYQNLRATPAQDPTVPPTTNGPSGFEQKKAAVDSNPQRWLTDTPPLQFTKEGIAKPTDSKDPEFLYLYGRALLLSGNQREAMQAFELALTNLRTETRASLPLRTEVSLADAAAALRLQNGSAAGKTQESLLAEQKAIQTLDDLLGLKHDPAPK
jgi:serine/threonine protein phosphatase PrpC